MAGRGRFGRFGYGGRGWRARAVASVVTLLAVSVGACHPSDSPPEKPKPAPKQPIAKKPSWWPKKAERPEGMDWPPPRPPTWPPGKPWPPIGVDLEDPQWWIDLYGVKGKPERGKPLKDGNAGSRAFSKNFRNLLECDDGCVPGCNMFTLIQYDQTQECTETGCTPYPGAKIQNHCKAAFNAQTAANTCRVFCQRNKDECRRDKLFVPPMAGEWSCMDGACRMPHGAACEACTGQWTSTDCRAYFLCSCWEN